MRPCCKTLPELLELTSAVQRSLYAKFNLLIILAVHQSLVVPPSVNDK